MNLQEKNSSRTRLEQREADIIAAATTLFAGDGFHATSTRKIAAAAGVSEGTVFHYFSTKHDLLLAILDGFYSDLTDSARTVIQDVMDTRARLQLLAENHVQALINNKALMMRLIQAYLSVDLNFYTDYRKTHIHKLNYEYTRVFDAVIREGIQRGYLDPDLNLSAIRDLYFGGLEYGVRTLLGRKSTNEVSSYVHIIIQPLWLSMQHQPKNTSKTDLIDVEARMEKACKRIEKAAKALEGKNAG